MDEDDIEFRIDIPEHRRAHYRSALERGDLRGLRDVLLSCCTEEDRDLVERLLPQALIDTCQAN